MTNVLPTLRFTVLRLIRNWIVLLLLLGIPIVLITFFALILGDSKTEAGMPYIQESTTFMVLAFQLFGGSIVMSYIHEDFFTERRFRIQSLPFNQTLYAFSISVLGTLFSIFLGGILVFYSFWVFNVEWGNIGWAVFVIALMALLSSIVCLIFTFAVKQFKVAERLSEVYGIGAIVLAGLFFPMPENAFFEFMGSYGNPLTLASAAIFEYQAGNVAEVWLNVSILLGAIIVAFFVMLALGRRRMG